MSKSPESEYGMLNGKKDFADTVKNLEVGRLLWIIHVHLM
jgi:hypothetical protein